MALRKKDATGLGAMGTHYTRYAIGNVLSLAAGFVSFPILTRTLTNYEFGVIGYIDAILLLVAAAMKFGLGDALLRFYPHGEGEPGLRRFLASVLLVPLTASFTLWLLLMAALAVAVAAGWVQNSMAAVLALAGIPFTIFFSYVQWLMGAQERSGINALTGTSGRWLQTALVVALVLVLAPTAGSVYLGRLLAAMVMAVWMGWWLLGQARFRFSDADLGLTRTVLVYALPLALNEISQVLFGFADRLILNAVLGDLAAVGIYSIGSSLAMYVSVLLGTTLGQAYTPVLNRLYIQDGAAAVVGFKNRILVPMTYVIVLLVAGLILTGNDFFLMIAGPDKQLSAPIFVMLSVTFAGSTLFVMAGYGAMLAKRTGLLLAANLVAVAVKVALNFLLIPVSGVMGTVYATMLSQVVLLVGLYLTCPPPLRCLPPLRDVVRALAMAIPAIVAGWFALRAIPLQPPVVRVAVGVSVVMTLYLVPLLLFVPAVRKYLREILPLGSKPR